MSRVLPILFNTEMVRAILDGRKTCTRRIIKPHYKDDECGFQICRNVKNPDDWYVEKVDEEEMSFENTRFINPPFIIGDIIYVRETWQRNPFKNDVKDWNISENDKKFLYRADFAGNETMPASWHPSIHMPKKAARIWLKVTDVRVERLQDMSAEDALREGIEPYINQDGTLQEDATITSFIGLWNSTVKKSDIDTYGWNASPWVWVIEFERCEKPQEGGE